MRYGEKTDSKTLVIINTFQGDGSGIYSALKGMTDREICLGVVSDINWADCTLRRWLNGEFFNKAFNEQEQSLIKTSYAIFTIKNQQNILNFFINFNAHRCFWQI